MLKRIFQNAATRIIVSIVVAVFFAFLTRFANADTAQTGVCRSNSGIQSQSSSEASCYSYGQSYIAIYYPGQVPTRTCWQSGTPTANGGCKYQYGIRWVQWERAAGQACVAPDVYNSSTFICESPEPPPPYECGIGYYNSDGGATVASCVPVPPAEGSCQISLGYIEESEICADAANECAASGGSYGVVGLGAIEDSTAVCIPPGDDIPQCEPGSFVGITDDAGAGFSCVSTGAAPPPPTPPLDSDDDGTPDSTDTDDDNDGIPDSTDTDDNGDGQADTNTDTDPEPDQVDDDDDDDGISDAEDVDDNGDGVGDCDSSATDYLQCIGGNDSMDENEKKRIISNYEFAAGAQLALYESKLDTLQDGGFTEAPAPPTAIGEFLENIGWLAVSCQDMTFPFNGGAWVIECSKTQFLRDIHAMVIAFFTMLSIWNTAIGSAPGKENK